MKPFVTAELIESIPSDPHQGLLALCEAFRDWSDAPDIKDSKGSDKRILFLEAYHLLKQVAKRKDLEAFVDAPQLDEKATEVIKATSFMYSEALEQIYPFVKEREEQELIDGAETKVAQLLGTTFTHRLSDNDLARIRELIQELLETIAQSEDISGSYERRLIKRIEALQAGLANTMTSLEMFYILLSDAGVIYHKNQQTAVHSVKLIKQIVAFAWRSQVIAEDLPSDSQLNIPINANFRDDDT